MFEEFPELLGNPKYLGIVGSREYKHIDHIETVIDAFPVGTPLVTGDAKGVDTIAFLLGKELGNIPIRVTACWGAHGRGAGFIRNPVIIDISGGVVAFWDGESSGTLNSINNAYQSRKPCIVVYDDEMGSWDLVDYDFAKKHKW